jgi:hypothetical protein
MICGLLIADLILIRVTARSRLSPTFVEKP